MTSQSSSIYWGKHWQIMQQSVSIPPQFLGATVAMDPSESVCEATQLAIASCNLADISASRQEFFFQACIIFHCLSH
jgi:hypothetical protein